MAPEVRWLLVKPDGVESGEDVVCGFIDSQLVMRYPKKLNILTYNFSEMKEALLSFITFNNFCIYHTCCEIMSESRSNL